MRGGNHMENQLPELKVNMLGRFSITYGEQPIYNRIHRTDLKNPVINHKIPHTI